MPISSAQIVVDKLETFPDGTIIVSVGGVEYRGLNADAMRSVLKLREDNKLLKAQYNESVRLFDEYKTASEDKLVKINNANTIKIQEEQARTKFFTNQYEEEKKLRLKFQDIVDGCSGKIIFFRVCI